VGKGWAAGLPTVRWKYRKEKNFSCYNGMSYDQNSHTLPPFWPKQGRGIFFPTIWKKNVFVQPNKKVLHQLNTVEMEF
jgi:hypothetical protein